MVIAYTPQTLVKLEKILTKLDWHVRYEKGNFQSGSCMFKAQKTVVINKFVPLEQKINSLIELIQVLDIHGIESAITDAPFFTAIQKMAPRR